MRAKRQQGSTHSTEVYERLRQDVISAAIEPGQMLRIDELRSRYHIGLAPIREALNRAVGDGLVVRHDLRGFMVKPVSRDDLLELTRARCWLTEILVRESIRQGDQAWEENIVVMHHRLIKTPRQVEGQAAHTFSPAWEQVHRDFHAALIAACGSRWLLEVDRQLFDAADRYRHLARRTAITGTPARPEQHHHIMEAFLARDTAKATQLLQAHYERTSTLSLAELDRQTPT